MKFESLGKYVSLSQGMVVNKSTAHLFSEIEDEEHIYPLLRIVDFESGNHANYSKYVSKNVPQKVVIDVDAILFTRVTCQCFRGFKGVFHNNLFKVELINDALTEDYLYVVLQSEYVKKQALRLMSSSVVPDLTHDLFKSIIIPVPDIQTQKRIAEIFLSINKKISINNSIISNIEAMAKEIYDYWFVQFDFPNETGKPYKQTGGQMVWNEALNREIPYAWDVRPLSEAFGITMGSSPSGKTLNEDGEGIEFYQGSTDFGNLYPSPRVFTTGPVRYAKAQDVLLSVRAPVGDMNIAMNDCCIGRGLAAIHHNSTLYMWCTMQTFKPFFSKYNNTGTTFGALTSNDLKGQLAICPPDGILQNYVLQVKPLEKSLRIYTLENEELAKIRDYLLPMLLNGQISFK